MAQTSNDTSSNQTSPTPTTTSTTPTTTTTSPTTTTTTTPTSTANARTSTTTTTIPRVLEFERFLQSGNGTSTQEQAQQEQTERVIETCPDNWINRFSLANRSNDENSLEKTDIYNFFTIIVLLLCMQFIRKIQKQTAIICDERAITASDFTCKITNIPKDFTDKEDIDEEIRKFFIHSGLPGQTLNVQQVSVCYNCDEIVAEDKKLRQAIESRAQMLAKKNRKQLVSDDEIRKAETQITTSRKAIENISKKFHEGVGVSKQFEGEAYVTFETQQGIIIFLSLF